ncbi:DUF4960 domain-containing protein [Winogradskyella forsetii]|uniref:DUF4960 domain-containing protein n=1 Tax=Winogradskyella forsetii TaxID=2686077 RepID=UPI0015BBD768|nr:DUF4960 domain-containing protein [Winogradskyella forsetii]
MIKIIKRIAMFLVFGFLLTLTSSCEDLELDPINPTIAQKVSGLSVDLNGDDAVLTWTNPSNVSSIVVSHTDGIENIQSAAITFSYGIIDVNKDYTFTVKTKDAEGNLSLGETVSLRREGPEAVRNFNAQQGGSNLILTWDLIETGLQSIRLQINNDIVNLPGDATSYTISDIAEGDYTFKINTFDTANVISPSRIIEYLVSFDIRKIAFLGAAAENTPVAWDACNGGDFTVDDDETAAQWFPNIAGPFTEVTYHSFTDVANGEVDLSVYHAIWIQFDGGWWGDRVAQFPNNGANCIIGEGPADSPACSDLADNLINRVTTYYEAGGNLLVSNFAAFILDDIGVVDGNGVPNQAFGGIGYEDWATGDAWGGSWTADTSSPYFTGVSSNAGGCIGADFETLAAGTLKKNRVAQYNMDFGPWEAATLDEARSNFEAAVGGNILWGNCVGNEVWGVEWPSDGTAGTVVCAIGGTWDWEVGGVPNGDNMKIITKNILNHLADLGLSN